MNGNELLYSWRKGKGLTQLQAAEKMGLSLRQYRYIENGERKPPELRAQDIARRTGQLVPASSWQ